MELVAAAAFSAVYRAVGGGDEVPEKCPVLGKCVVIE